MRVAWFTPLPPHRSGIAAYSADVLPALSGAHTIDVFVEGPPLPAAVAAVPAGVGVRNAFDFACLTAQHPYDVVVYQIGNDSCHDYMWPYLLRYPGLVVMHDAQLHQARARALLRRGQEEDYVREFTYSHEGIGEGVARMVAAGLDSGFYYVWPMIRIPVEAARLLAVHNRWLAGHVREQWPSAQVTRIAQGVPDPLPLATIPAAEVRQRHGIPSDAVVFAAYGRVTPPKGLTTVLTALAQAGDRADRAHVLCVGDTTDEYDLLAEAQALGLGARVHITGYVPDDELPSYLVATDVGLCLRWPTARETSASWLRCVAAGRPTIVHDLLHTEDVPTIDLRSMTVRHPGRGPVPDPMAVGIDLLDENSMLRVSIARLTDDPGLRQRLGSAARRFWSAEATIERMARDYDLALDQAAALPAPRTPATWPRHLLADGSETARRIAFAVGGGDEAVTSALAQALGPSAVDRHLEQPGD